MTFIVITNLRVISVNELKESFHIQTQSADNRNYTIVYIEWKNKYMCNVHKFSHHL